MRLHVKVPLVLAMEKSEQNSSSKVSGRVIGIGTAYLTITQIIFFMSTNVIHLGLGRYFGPSIYGTFGVVMSIYLIIGSILNSGVPKAVSKVLSGNGEHSAAIIKESMSIQFKVAAILSLILIIFAKQFALILRDVSLSKYVIVLGIMTVPYSYYTLNLSGFLNGRHMFKYQAITAIVHHITRLVAVFLLVALGFSVLGTFLGYFVAIITGIIYSNHILKKNPGIVTNHSFKKEIIRLATPLTLIALGFTLIRNVNTLFLKKMLVDTAAVGHYTAAVTLANVPYLLLAAFPLTLLPSISKAIADDNFPLAQKYISRSLRYLLMLILPFAALIAATATDLLSLLYSGTYAPGGPSLAVLAVSSVSLSFFMTLGSILIAGGHAKIKLAALVVVIPLLFSLNILFIPKYGILGAAITALLASSVAAIITGIFVYQKFRKLTELKSVVRISFCSVIIFVIAYHNQFSGPYLLAAYAFLGSLYLLLLKVVGELQEDDFKLFYNLTKIRK